MRLAYMNVGSVLESFKTVGEKIFLAQRPQKAQRCKGAQRKPLETRQPFASFAPQREKFSP
jgi:hypothetical protein